MAATPFAHTCEAWCGPSASRFGRGITNYDWFHIQAGDGFVATPDPRRPRIVYTVAIATIVWRSGNRSEYFTEVDRDHKCRPTRRAT